MTSAIQTPRPAKTPARSSARNDLNRIEAAGIPWWAHAPSVAMTCFTVAVAPLKFLASAADFALSLAFLSIFAVIGLVYCKVIPDTAVAAVLNEVGTRILGILETSGLF